MEWLRLGLLIVHVLGFAALIGGLLAQGGATEKRVNGAMRDGALAPGLLPAGQISGAIDEWITVAEFVPAVVREARAIIRDLHTRLGGEVPGAAGR